MLTEEGQRLFVTLIAGKFGKEPIFTRSDGGLWGKSHQLHFPVLGIAGETNIHHLKR